MKLTFCALSLIFKDTGCGKTTVVQLMSVLLNRELQIVNCHASTETSDLLGGLRPLRGRRTILKNLIKEAYQIIDLVNDFPVLQGIEPPSFLISNGKYDKEHITNESATNEINENVPSDAAQQVSTFVKKLEASLSKMNLFETNHHDQVSQCEKKRKLDNGVSERISPSNDLIEVLSAHIRAVVDLYQQYVSLFEWIDGPLVSAMKSGDLFLLDEMSLAEDAVLERLNSVLEPSRTLTLAEKGGDLPGEESGKSSVVLANNDFRVFATMNPGGDFGKKELSPALRSRFTEIWVPAVTDCADIDLVLEQSLSSSLSKTIIDETKVLAIKTSMLDYVNWFNNKVCGNPMSTCADFSLSLRDVLAWARFIIDTNTSCVQNLGLWAALVHGASLMHLDGLGLGTGLTQDDATSTKNKAKAFLREQIPHNLREKYLIGFENELDGLDESQLLCDKKFGIEPFMISVGPESTPDNLGFKMSAPTTALNLRRVLRAMQISKPILLEGSPGVGKTSLVSALASMSGHTLVRINLSEQTDITDLMGSDLPVPDEGNDQASGASFQWCDGALLRAIKNGHWVLLDELNLASQSVLEGLNSCLDHRASVYIPELGETFRCPPTFRIFAAQNPLAQGGGRKGLPKSFLNRFTKVYVEALTTDDLRGIVSTKFPMIPPKTVEDIVQFNCIVQEDIDNRQYGQLGSPWEFNLRDVFRWCELVSHSYKETGAVDCDKFADTIYIQRLRTEKDRNLVTKRYKECFGDSSCFTRTPKFLVSDQYVEVGNAKMHRSTEILASSEDNLIGDEPAYLRSLLRPMEAVAFCVRMNWPCLLVGPPASGKSTVLKMLAQSCNVKLEEVVLTPSSDVNELIGCFEQIDAAEVVNRLLQSFRLLVSYASTALIHSDPELGYLQRMNFQYFSVHKKIMEMRDALGVQNVFSQAEILSSAKELIATAICASSHFHAFSKLSEKIIRLVQEDMQSLERTAKTHDGAVHFRWVDGILVTALEKGYWLHLENVNFCPSSVLDRLNPLMETDGVLVLTECGIQEDGRNNGTSRIVKPHPNFRLFLSTNPSFGEVSRAMRNRCIEVSLLVPIKPRVVNLHDTDKALHSSMQTSDTLDLLENTGLASSSLAKTILHVHLNEFGVEEATNEDGETVRSIKELAILSADALHRGFVGDAIFQMAKQVAYGGNNYHPNLSEGESNGSEQLVHSIKMRKLLSGSRIESNVYDDARLIRAMESWYRIPLGLSCFGKDTVDQNGQLNLFDKFAPGLSNDSRRLTEVRCFLIANFISRTTENDDLERYHLLAGYSEPLQKALSYMLVKFLAVPKMHDQLRMTILTNRLAAVYSEYELCENIKCTSPDTLDIKRLSVMELSFAIFENKVDRSHINCPIIPFIYPMFIAIDTFLGRLACTAKFVEESIMNNFEHLRRFLSSRDRLWIFLKESCVLLDSSFLGFDETAFLVHWSWLKKSLCALDDVHHGILYSEITAVKRQFDLIISSIDRQLLISSSADYQSLSNNFWKVAGHPLVPADADDWSNIYTLRQSDATLSPLNENFNFTNIASGSRRPMKLGDLIDCQHPCLSATNKIKLEILSALSMAHWTTTDEMTSSIRKEKKNYDISKVVALLVGKMKLASQELKRQLHLHAVDTSVHLESNKLDLEDLEKLKESCSGDLEDNGIYFVHNLLSTFGRIQLMQAVEFWCVKEEKWIIESLAELMISCDTNIVQVFRKSILPRIKAFIDTVAHQTMWPLSDLRPLQSFAWAIESPHVSILSLRHLFRCTYSTLLVTSTRHHWCNSFNDLLCVSDALVSPPFWNSGISQQNGQHEVPETFGCDMGSARLQHNVISACIFRLLGLNGDTIYSSHKHPYITLENFEIRETQSRGLSQFLCTDLPVIDQYSTTYNVLLFFIDNILNALHESFDEINDVERLRLFVLGLGEFILLFQIG